MVTRPFGSKTAGEDGIPSVDPRLEGGYRIAGQPVAGAALGPEEADRLIEGDRREACVLAFVCQQHPPRIPVTCGRDDEDSSPALCQPEGAAIDDPIRPPVAKPLQILDHVGDAAALIQMQHEVDILDHDPGYPML